MARRVKANSGRQEKRENGPVQRQAPREGWTAEEALDMLRQGYGIEHVSERTGYAVRWLSAQDVPAQPLARQPEVVLRLKGVARRR